MAADNLPRLGLESVDSFNCEHGEGVLSWRCTIDDWQIVQPIHDGPAATLRNPSVVEVIAILNEVVKQLRLRTHTLLRILQFVDFLLKMFKKAACMGSIHLRVVELEGDGQLIV